MTDRDADRPTVSRRTVLKGIGSVAGATALAGCSSVAGGAGGEQLRFLQVLAPQTLDPIEVDDPWSAQPASRVFDGLYTYDRESNLVPVLAAGPPEVSADATTYTVTLESDARFQNGDDVTAADVAYSFAPETYEAAESPNVWQVNMLEEIRTPDERTVEFSLRDPYPAFEHTLTRGVVPKSVRERDPEAFGTETTVGSGPYEVADFAPKRYALLSRWADYPGPSTPRIESVKFVPNHAGLSRSMSLLTNQSDVIERVHPKLWGVTERSPNANRRSTESYHAHFVGFNCSPGGPTRKPKVREAIDYLFSMDDIVESVVHPSGQRQYSPLPSRLVRDWEFPLDDWRDVPHGKDERKARELIREADVDDWTPLVATPHDKMREKIAETIVHGLRQVGFGKARVEKYHWSEFRERVTTGDSEDYDMYVGSWSGYPDPDTFLYPLFHESMEGLTNGTFYRNETVMDRLERARRTTDRERRRELYTESITAILEDRVCLPAFTLDNSFGVEDRVDGFDPHPLSDVNPRLVAPGGDDSLSM